MPSRFALARDGGKISVTDESTYGSPVLTVVPFKAHSDPLRRPRQTVAQSTLLYMAVVMERASLPLQNSEHYMFRVST
jgi:hypothetical protein